MHSRAELGRRGEDLAVAHLLAKGYRVLERNVRSRYGEIDIVALDGDCIVFIEVRSREFSGVQPEESVTRAKQRRMANLGLAYLQAHHDPGAEWRADVVAVEFGLDGQPLRLDHHVNAVEEE